MATNYAELKAEIEQWLDNSNPNLIAAIPTFITFAEAFFRRELHVREMECRATHALVPVGTADADRGVYTLPTNWGGHRTIEIVENELISLYWRRLTTLSDTCVSNWLLAKHPDLYLYASLGHAEAWLKNDPRIEVWAKAANAALAEVKDHDIHDRYSGGPIRSRSLSERPWRGYDRRDGRLEFLSPFDFFDLDASGLQHSVDEAVGFFTVAENQLRIWPRPQIDPVGVVGWQGCDDECEAPATQCCVCPSFPALRQACFENDPILYFNMPFDLTLGPLDHTNWQVDGGAITVTAAEATDTAGQTTGPADGDYIRLTTTGSSIKYTSVEYTGTDLLTVGGNPVCAFAAELQIKACA